MNGKDSDLSEHQRTLKGILKGQNLSLVDECLYLTNFLLFKEAIKRIHTFMDTYILTYIK